MSEAPHIELDTSSFLEPATSAATDSYANGNSTAHSLHSVEAPKHNILDTAPEDTMASPASKSSKQAKAPITNGPVAQNVKAETAKTKDEFSDLANSRVTPAEPAATGQPLTHYHSLFYRLLSWKNPRATAISFVLSVAFIFTTRYLNILRYVFKGLYVVLGVSATAELASKSLLGNGFISNNLRPKKYFTIPKASLERLLDDVEQFLNFIVIEAQRIVFAENAYVTVGAAFSAFVSYFLIKFVPLWGLTLITTSLAYLGPLIYIKNKEAIDGQLQNASHIVNQQAAQIKDLAAKRTGNAAKTFQSYAGEYSSKAQSTINQYRGRSTSQDVAIKKEDFPSAPKATPVSAEPKSPAKVPEAAF